MPISLRVDPTAHCVFGRVTSEPTDNDVLEFQQALADHPDHDSGFDMLLDFSAAKGELVTPEGLRLARRAAERHRTHLVGCRCAIVVATKLAFGMARMFEILSSDTLEVRVFHDMPKARRWLGLAEQPEELRSNKAGA